MAKFTLSIDCNNAAFDDDAPAEIARILREVANDIDGYCMGETVKVRDVNGNTVGRWSYKGERAAGRGRLST